MSKPKYRVFSNGVEVAHPANRAAVKRVVEFLTAPAGAWPMTFDVPEIVVWRGRKIIHRSKARKVNYFCEPTEDGDDND